MLVWKGNSDFLKKKKSKASFASFYILIISTNALPFPDLASIAEPSLRERSVLNECYKSFHLAIPLSTLHLPLGCNQTGQMPLLVPLLNWIPSFPTPLSG